jgi:hypothetical protein
MLPGVKMSPRLPQLCSIPKISSKVFLFVLKVSMVYDFFILLPIGEYTFPLIVLKTFLFYYFDGLFHFLFVLEVEKESSFGVDEVEGKLSGNIVERYPVFENEAVFDANIHA